MAPSMWESISTPPSSCTPGSPMAQLDGEKESKIANLIAYFSDAEYRVGESNSGTEGALTEDEKMFLSKEGIARFLTAVKWDEKSAKLRLDRCLVWKRSMGVWDLEKTAEEVAPESPSGKEFVIGYTGKSQPILHFLPNKSTTETSERQFKHVIYMMDRTIDLFPPGVQNWMLIISFVGKRSAPTSPSMAQRFITTLSSHYPERLGTAVLLDIPWIAKKFLDFAFVLLDPVTKQKVRWNIDIVEAGLASKEGACQDYGGEIPFTYKHDEYWPMLLEICLQRRELYRENWRRLGGRVGLLEWDFKQPSENADKTADLVTTPEVAQTSPPSPTESSMTKGGDDRPVSSGGDKNNESGSSSSAHTLHEAQGEGDPVGLDADLKGLEIRQQVNEPVVLGEVVTVP